MKKLYVGLEWGEHLNFGQRWGLWLPQGIGLCHQENHCARGCPQAMPQVSPVVSHGFSSDSLFPNSPKVKTNITVSFVAKSDDHTIPQWCDQGEHQVWGETAWELLKKFPSPINKYRFSFFFMGPTTFTITDLQFCYRSSHALSKKRTPNSPNLEKLPYLLHIHQGFTIFFPCYLLPLPTLQLGLGSSLLLGTQEVPPKLLGHSKAVGRQEGGSIQDRGSES
jgi:hypothetical protein